MRQRVRNACGTVAAAHAIANCGEWFQVRERVLPFPRVAWTVNRMQLAPA